MPRYLFIILLTLLLQPSLSRAQVPDPSETSTEAQRKAAEEAKRRRMAEEEAKRKSEEEKRKAAIKKMIAEGGNAVTGLQLLKIPVTGPYYLGMLKREYDSTAMTNTVSVTTEKQVYKLDQSPYFYYGRLYMLSLSLPDSVFSNDLPDLTSYYENRFGRPDEKKQMDSVMVFPSAADSSLQGSYRVKEATLTWHYTTHDVVIRYRLTDMKNNMWKGFYLLRYNGTVEYVKGLGRLQEKEKSKEN